MASDFAVTGRTSIDDLDELMAISNTDVDAIDHLVRGETDTIFTWDYERSRPALNTLYEKGKSSQWNAATDLDWSIKVDQTAEILRYAANVPNAFGEGMELKGTAFEGWGEDEWIQLGIEQQNWALSQFLHAEQGALICTSQLVATVPWIDAKYYAATQVIDEARHVEVFSRYLDEKLSGHYAVDAHLRLLLDEIILDQRWDMTYLGMQVMVEGLALASFSFMHAMTTEPLLKKMLGYVMSDEARHLAFGVLSLREFYEQLTKAEIRERQEFAFEAAVRMRDRLLQHDVWVRMGVDVKEALKLVLQDENRQMFQALLFAKIVPNCKKLGLLDAGDGWLRDRFTDLGVIQFEDWIDTSSEYESLDQVARDREVAVT